MNKLLKNINGFMKKTTTGSKRGNYNLKVIGTQQLTPNMRRISLGGESLMKFPVNCAGGYIKLLFDPMVGQKPVMRTYTIRSFDHEKLILTVDFVTHDHTGPASQWAMTCKIGDQLSIAGPGSVKFPDLDAQWYLIIGDMTAVPAISVILDTLPQDCEGHLVIEVLTKDDIPSLNIPKKIKPHWIINSEPGNASQALVAKVKQLTWKTPEPAVWTACEFSSMRTFREYFQKTRNLKRNSFYLSSYWKSGLVEEEHKVLKQKDSTENR